MKPRQPSISDLGKSLSFCLDFWFDIEARGGGEGEVRLGGGGAIEPCLGVRVPLRRI